ncbi:Protein SDA1 [Gonapodya sp. JEL0774]|nr:Protein SDA1 [Gonapodya sp. JEL0774]
MSKSSARSRLDPLNLNLPQLQNLIKRDPPSYLNEFNSQLNHFNALLNLFLLNPSDSNSTDDFAHLISFIAHVAPCYPSQCRLFPQQISDLLSNHYQVIPPDLRRTMVQALILLRNRDLVKQTSLLPLFFLLFRCRDKPLRALLHAHIVADVKQANHMGKNNALNKSLQNFMYTMLGDGEEIACKKSLDVMIDLYKKSVWNDAKTVNVIGSACFHSSPKVCATAINFFLGGDAPQDDEEHETEVPDLHVLKHQAHIKKKKKSEKRGLDKAMATIKKKERLAAHGSASSALSFPPLHLLNDPQTMAEKLFARLRNATSQATLPFPLRLAHLDLITRLVGAHKLVLLNVYPFVAKYLNPHQRDVTRLLACAAQATHELVPPDATEEIVRAVADRFVWANGSAEVVVAGLNAIRELCARQPLAMPGDLLDSLVVDHKGHREKGVTNATRALVALFRDVNPELLHKKHRGKVGTIEVARGTARAKAFGQLDVAEGVEGAEMLEEMDVDGDGEEGSDDEKDGEEGDGEEEDDDGDGDSWADVDEEDSDGEDDGEEDGVDDREDGEQGEDNDEDHDTAKEVEKRPKRASKADRVPKLVAIEEERADAVDPSKSKDDVAGGEEEVTNRARDPAAPRIESQKILTDDDFRRLKRLRIEKEALRLSGQGMRIKDGGAKGKKRPHAEVEVDSDGEYAEHDDGHDEPADFVDPDALLRGYKRKQNKEERMASIQAGREGREKYGSRMGKHEGSTTNKVKSKKTKNIMMMVHKREVWNKKTMSSKEKNHRKREHAKRQKRGPH